MAYELIKDSFPPSWKQILRETCNIANLSVEEFADSPFWYSERTLCGLIASAANKAGCLALCEMWTEKNRLTEKHGQTIKQANGFLDIYMKIGRNTLWIEAKVAGKLSAFSGWDGKMPQTILTGVEKAVADANKILGEAEDYSGDVYALTFTRLYLTKENYEDLNRNARREGLDSEDKRKAIFKKIATKLTKQSKSEKRHFRHAALIADTGDQNKEGQFFVDFDQYPVGLIMTLTDIPKRPKVT